MPQGTVQDFQRIVDLKVCLRFRRFKSIRMVGYDRESYGLQGSSGYMHAIDKSCPPSSADAAGRCADFQRIVVCLSCCV